MVAFQKGDGRVALPRDRLRVSAITYVHRARRGFDMQPHKGAMGGARSRATDCASAQSFMCIVCGEEYLDMPCLAATAVTQERAPPVREHCASAQSFMCIVRREEYLDMPCLAATEVAQERAPPVREHCASAQSLMCIPSDEEYLDMPCLAATAVA